MKYKKWDTNTIDNASLPTPPFLKVKVALTETIVPTRMQYPNLDDKGINAINPTLFYPAAARNKARINLVEWNKELQTIKFDAQIHAYRSGGGATSDVVYQTSEYRHYEVIDDNVQEYQEPSLNPNTNTLIICIPYNFKPPVLRIFKLKPMDWIPTKFGVAPPTTPPRLNTIQLVNQDSGLSNKALPQRYGLCFDKVLENNTIKCKVYSRFVTTQTKILTHWLYAEIDEELSYNDQIGDIAEISAMVTNITLNQKINMTISWLE